MRVFLTVMQERSVTRAAERLHLTQPAVSYALARLREKFDDPLFLRTAAGMQPTPVAFALAGPIGQGMDAFADALSLRHRFDPPPARGASRCPCRTSVKWCSCRC